MSETPPPFKIHLETDSPEQLAGEWFTITLRLKRPRDHQRNVRLRTLACKNPSAQIRNDLLEQNVLLHPDETYVLTAQLLVLDTGRFSFDDVLLHYHYEDGEPAVHPLGESATEIRPALGREINIEQSTICNYGEAVKMSLKVTHCGKTTFNNFRITFLPADGVKAGKSHSFTPTLKPGDTQELTVAASEGELRMVLTGSTAEGHALMHTETLSVHPPEEVRRMRFQFLKPRSLSSIPVRVCPRDSDQGVSKPRTRFHLVSGQGYKVIIQPHAYETIKDIEGHTVPGAIHARLCKSHPRSKTYEMDIEVSHTGFFSKPERFHFTIKYKDDENSEDVGEIDIMLIPPWTRHLKLAVAVGLAATVQGIAGLGMLSGDGVGSPDLFMDFSLDNLRFLYLLLIPAIFFGLRLFDAVWRRIKS